MAAMQTSIQQKLSQQLALTPQLTQSLRLLAMNNLELDSYLDQLLESNPLLEMEQPESDDHPQETDTTQTQSDQASEDAWRETGDDRWESMYRQSGPLDDGREMQWQREQTLGESLHEQIDQQPMAGSEHALAHAIINSLDDDGYFRDDAVILAEQFTTTPEQVHHLLEHVIHRLDPAGIGARDPLECLLLQLGNEDADIWAQRLLLQYADHLTESDAVLAEMTGMEIAQIGAARARMQRLDPFPGHGLHGHSTIYIKPELIFRLTSDHNIEVEVPNGSSRIVTINDQWQGHQWKGKEKAFMDAASTEAKWLLYALEQRKESLLKVGTVLARRQRAFLEHGMLGIKPLTLQNVADEVELHESTVSRVTSGKYAQTPIGLIEMRRFFCAGLPTRGGGSVSVYRVLQRIRALIESEPPRFPIADQAIADRLQAEGIEIARRTIAKYREQLGLLTSSQRKKAHTSLKNQARSIK
ncbi:MAG: RNA polymerase factor sigma-54 [Mariprofundales bacterium]|nr:RNA polymerase factor sigma-54 [Mariprofundales bacterium]